ncbi:hypothetical protein [Paenibacillus sp. PL2-23]|uniref:hypothetical protein n=1 Tax=Paenibacillus sp. PL2-23 TaxID=2100729 RepID=UPI0030FBA85A
MADWKHYIITHRKLWWVYVISIPVSLLGLLVSVIFVVRLLEAMNVSASGNLAGSSFIAAFIGALPALYANTVAARGYSGKHAGAQVALTHLITLLVYFLIMYLCLYAMIIDFRR